MSNLLTFWKTYNNGIIQGQVVEVDPDGNETAFVLTGSTITVEIFDQTGTVAASIAGTIDDAVNGIYSAKPDADDLNGLTPGGAYYWRTKIVSATYPQGRLFAKDSHNQLQPAEIFGNSSGT